MTAPLIIFDLDGTLVDTAPDLVASVNHTIALDGLAPVAYSDLTYLVGFGAKAMIARAFEVHGAALDPVRHDELLAEFITFYANDMPGKSQPYPGLVAALDRLSSAGIKLAVCTNKMESLARPLIDRLGLSAYFPTITGGDTFSVRKPDAGHLLETIRLAGGSPARSIMVGDSTNDILVARNARVPSIAVLFGYADVPLESLDPTHQISHYDELTEDLIHRLLATA